MGKRRFVRVAVVLAAGCQPVDSPPPPDLDQVLVQVPWGVDADVRPVDDERPSRDTVWWSAPSVDSLFRDSLLERTEDQLPFRPQAVDSFGTEGWSDWRGQRADSGQDTRQPEGVAAPALAEIDLPLGEGLEGWSVLYTQILLDRARFSPGVMDGRWGSNTEKAVAWLQRREGIAPTSQVDSVTLRHLFDLAGRPSDLLTERVLSAEDVAGPFIPLPEDVYQRDSLECLCYESLAEKLAERAHTTVDILERLNPKVALGDVRAGHRLIVPNLSDSTDSQPDSSAALDSRASKAKITELVVSDLGGYLHALDGDGNVIFHFPVTLGSDYSPSPDGQLSITAITPDPWFHYQPSLLTGVPDDNPETNLAPGPNNPVGVVWMQLSKDHYGIHGTPAPETIGYASSSGCIRLTNWDARFLSRQVTPGVVVRFVDLGGASRS